MKMKMFLSFLCTVLVFSIISATVVKAESAPVVIENQSSNRTVESYELEVFSEIPNEINKVIGHKKVNAITEISQNTDEISANVISAEDYYDLNGNFIKSVVKIEQGQNNYNSGVIENTTSNKEFDTPKTILNVTSAKDFKGPGKIESSKNNDIAIENHLATLTKEKKNFNVKKQNVPGFTKSDLIELRSQLTEIKEQHFLKTNELKATQDLYSTSSIIRAGAFDNYYNYDGVTGNFTVQALTYSSAHKYFKRTGTTRNNATNNNSYVAFKDNIDGYEKNAWEYMEGSKFAEVTSWASFVASASVFIGTTLTGPAGWLAAIGAALNVVLLLGSYTSALYATSYRAGLSKNAASYLSAAQGMIAYGSWSGGTYTTVSGF